MNLFQQETNTLYKVGVGRICDDLIKVSLRKVSVSFNSRCIYVAIHSVKDS